ncbi:DUF2637 domain-containing protein [Streptomyces kaniharaensis]|uniref:DUF2637 domain-containing protein n=1 Tax=Streptomyces kaniharaensis TaxID=212423 RepID=UPI001E39ADC2|nr:DUF2637 domain-containing protein [Streptomyces kaniharaensis]
MRRLVKASAAGGAVIAAIGFVGSYKALQKLAEHQGQMGTFSYVFPVGIDAGIAVLLALDLVLTWLRIRFPLLRYIAWMLTAGTIVFNAASAYPKPLPMALHALLPVLFVGVVEAGRYAVARIAAIEAGRPEMEGVRFFRWILSPLPTFKLWRKMKIFEITSYAEIVDMEQRRLVYRAVLRHRYGRGWRRAAPVEEVLPLKLARYGRALPYLEPPETDLTREYAPKITVERADQPTVPAPVAELPPAITPELLERLSQLLDRAETGSTAQQLPAAGPEAVAEPVPAEIPEQPVELVEAELEQPELTVEQPAASLYSGMVPLRKLERPVTEPVESSWFHPEPAAPAEVPWQAPSDQGSVPWQAPAAPAPVLFDQAVAERPSAAESPRPAGVHARLPHQETVLQPVVEQLPAEPVADLLDAEPTVPVVEQPAAPIVPAELGDDQQPGEPPADQEEEIPAPKLSGKQLLLQLLQSLTPEQKSMNQKQLAAELFPQLRSVMSSEESVRKYIGAWQRNGTI